ncbi:MAG: hypothetical protein SO193_03445, partial [Sodaliphilus sp.]|nr:hypothetical protein [Sodaliphilus sp.]
AVRCHDVRVQPQENLHQNPVKTRGKHTSKRNLRKNAHTASNKPSEAHNSNSFHTKKRFPKNRENASIAVIFFQKTPLALKNPPKTRIFSVLSKYRVPTMQNRFEKFDAAFYQEIMLS